MLRVTVRTDYLNVYLVFLFKFSFLFSSSLYFEEDREDEHSSSCISKRAVGNLALIEFGLNEEINLKSDEFLLLLFCSCKGPF